MSTSTFNVSIHVGGSGIRGFGWFLFIVSLLALIVTLVMKIITLQNFGWLILIIVVILVGFIMTGFYVIPEWIRVPTLLLGRYRAMKGPGVFWLFPMFYTIPFALDIRIITSMFSAEQTLTMDNVPVNVDAVLFWQVVDPYKAAIKVQDYQNAIRMAAQTSLRDIIGKNDLSMMLSGRERLASELQKVIDAQTETWGVKSNSVEIRDVIIPSGLQDAMSRQAQAERERQARIILAGSEEQIAQKFINAAKVYEGDRLAFDLRAMNILYESMKEKGAWIVVPSGMVNILGASTRDTEANKK